jgi:tetratricopeptide (TPR) repeat protein
MSKRTRIHKHLAHLAPRAEQEAISPDAALARGWDAFNTARFGEAIKLWEHAARHNPAAVPALAEAYFRRALAPTTTPEQQLLDLQRATALAPNDGQYYYHLGLVHHRRGDLATALTAYELAAAANPPPRGLPFTFALAKLEADPNADVSTIPGLSELEHEIIEMLAHFLRGGTTQSKRAAHSWVTSLFAKFSGADAVLALWRGLGYLLADDDAAAQSALTSANRLTPHGETLKHYYLGTVAARRGDWSAATISWRQAQARGLATPWLRENLAAVYLPNAITAFQSENWQAAIEQARAALQANTASADATQIAVIALDRLAHAAASAGKWAQAAAHWNEASQVAHDAQARTIWHNLAIAAEQSENWAQAATAWRELLKFKPRGKRSAKDVFTDAHWAFIRKRATQDLQKAGRLGEAITLMKQKIKATPNDLVARMELVDALIANEQDTAARNELQRILQTDAHFRDARIKLAEWHAARQQWFAAEAEMRLILEHDPTDETARKQIAILMTERGRKLHADGRIAAGRDVFEQALKYAPHNANLYIDLGRADLDLRQDDRARQDFELAYQHGAKQIHTHEQIARCWAIAQNLDEVKKAIARAERDSEPNPLFYVHVGLTCLETVPPPSPYAPPTAANQTWEKFGVELVERGVARNPNDIELIRHVVGDFAEAQSRFGAPYAERLTQLTPTDPMAWLTLAMFQFVSQDLEKAKASFKQTAWLARQQGNHELEQMAEEMRRALSDPMLTMALKMGMPLENLFGGIDEPDEFDEEDFDLFPMPRRRKKRR